MCGQFNVHKGGCSLKGECTRVHSCLRCSGDHPACECTTTAKEIAASGGPEAEERFGPKGVPRSTKCWPVSMVLRHSLEEGDV